MKHIKNLHFSPLAILYLAFFITSLWIGHTAGNKTRAAITQHNEPGQKSLFSRNDVLKSAPRPVIKPIKSGLSREEIPAPRQDTLVGPDRQRNILVIGVDNLESTQPRLKAIWIILYLNDLPHFMMLPIYPTAPSLGEVLPAPDSTLTTLFNLDSNKNPNPAFIQELAKKDLWWSGYMILDEFAIEELLVFSYVGETSQPGGYKTMPDPLDDPFNALMVQTRYAQDLCSRSNRFTLTNTKELLNLAANIYPHYTTDLDLELILIEIKNALKYNGGISCEFPSLTAIANLR